MNSCLCTLPDSFRYVVGNRQARSTQLFGIPIEPTLVQAFSNSMEFYCEIYRVLPNLEVLKTPMWTRRPHPAGFFPIGSFVCHLISHNLSLSAHLIQDARGAIVRSRFNAYRFALCSLRRRFRTSALASIVCTISPRWFVVTLRRRMIP